MAGFSQRIAASIFQIKLGTRIVAQTSALVLAVIIVIAASAAHAQTFAILHTFTGQGDGGTPYAGLTIDQAGNFYGTTSAGGAGYGTVFKLTHSGSNWVLSTLYAFQGGNDGGYPFARVVFGPDHVLYGTTSGDGNNGGFGTVFSLRPPSHPCRSINCPWTEAVLYRFTGTDDGGTPGYGDLAFDASGNIYGTTMYGGANCSPYYNCGVVFELGRSGGSWTESVLYSFSQTGNAGDVPYGGVILDRAGNLYGTTVIGGVDNGGVLFELTQSGSSWTVSVLHSFGGLNDGVDPTGGLIMDQQGNLYGSTTFGPGNGTGGTVYQLQPSGGSWTYSILAALSGFLGPLDALTMDAAGNLYATSYGGGSSTYGNVFKLTPSGGSWTYTDLHDFNGHHDGGDPIGGVVLDAHGNVYGTTSEFGHGEIWEITP
jgi:uncharacterized repeat protein (TIGR03803 family)